MKESSRREALREAIGRWSKVKSIQQGCDLMARCILGEFAWAPPHFIPDTYEELKELIEEGFLTEDVSAMAMEMSALNRSGMLTIDSQAGLIERGVSKKTGRDYVIKQREYVQGIVHRDIVSGLCDELRSRDVPHHFGHLSHELAEAVTLQNGEPVTVAANQSPEKMATYLEGFEYEGKRVFSKKFLEDIRRNGQTMIAWSHAFGPSALADHLRRSILSSGG